MVMTQREAFARMMSIGDAINAGFQRNKPTRYILVVRLINILLNKSDDAFDALMNALEKADQIHLAEYINSMICREGWFVY